MSKSKSLTFAKLDNFVNTRLVPLMEANGFQHVKRDRDIIRAQGDYRCFINYHIEVDRFDQGVLEIQFLAGYKSLCDAWFKMAGVEKSDLVTHIGFGGFITQIPPVENLFYVVDENNSTEVVTEKIWHRMTQIVLPFFDEFRDRSHLVDVWNRAIYHRLGGIQGRETQLAAAVLECFGDKSRAIELITCAIADAEAYLKRAKRKVDIVDGTRSLNQLQQALTYVKQ